MSMKSHWGTTYSDIIILVLIWNFEWNSNRKKQNRQFSTTPLSFGALYSEPHEYRNNPYIFTNYRISALHFSRCAIYTPGLDPWGTGSVSSFKFLWWPVGSERQERNVTEWIIALVLQGHPRSSILVPIESAARVHLFLLVVNSKVDPILHAPFTFRDTAA